jgi:Zn-dependent M28 family amino/carboxypeptidase
MSKSLPFLILITAALSCSQAHRDLTKNEVPFNRDSLARHIMVLASDSFGGRKPFSPGETKTVEYMETAFRSLGLSPGNGERWLQDVPMVQIRLSSDSVMKFSSPKGNFTLKNLKDYVISTQNTDSLITLDKDEVIFAGYGVVAPEYHWNDYAGINVKDKVVIVMVNDPGFGTADSSLFKGREMTYYGRWTYKYEEASRQGAKACLIIHNTEAASYPFSVVQNSWGSSNLFLDTRGSSEYHTALQGWISADAAKRILSAAGKDSSLLVSANNRGFKAIPLKETVSVNVHVQATYNVSHNVIAKIPGTKRPDEYIIYTAHWDHLGIGKPDAKGDSIYNGALDNASGSAALLEMARAFQNLSEKPERTVIFLSVTGEEQGLLGSEYYARHPLYPLKTTVANLNMDVVNPHERTKDVVVTGMGQNELEDYVADAVKIQDRYITGESHPEGGHYFRSDHFSFAKVGVPALDLSSGTYVAGKGKEYGLKLKQDYTANHYHTPSDEFDSSWTFAGGMEDMDLLFIIGKRLAFETGWPKWKAGSEFRLIREKK